jgi:hypothetical protein
MFIGCLILPAALACGQQWIGISSATPSSPDFSFSGNIAISSEVSVDIPGFYLSETLTNSKTVHSATVPGGHPMLIQGVPDLQKLNFTLQIPAEGNLKLGIISSEFIEYTDIELLPSAGNRVKGENPGELIKGESFTTNAFYPGELVDSELPFIVRNTRAQAFRVYPFQYNPVTRILRFYYHISLSITNTGGTGNNPLTLRDENTKQIGGIETLSLNKPVASFKSGKLPSARGCMLIICPAEFKNAVTPLAEWRIQTGIATEIIDAEQFAGPDDIYAFVKEYYYNKGNLAYLLLVGDAKHLPPYAYAYGSSDNYYSYLAGNDHYPDILVGRFSAESVEDIEVQVNRTLQYEKNPGDDAPWLTNAAGIASTLSPGDDGESDFQHVRNLLKTLKTTSYSETSEFFEGSQGEADANGNPSPADIVNKINQGTGVIFYAGHGSPGLWATSSLTKTAVENLSNINKYPLIWSAACENGNFAGNYCLAEAWLRARNSSGQPTGAIAALMASGTQTSFPPMEAQDKIAELLSNPSAGLSTMGAISVKGMMSMNDVYGSAGFNTTDTWILFGDPSLQVRTANPKELVAVHKGYIGSGRNTYTVNCNTSDGFACISQEGMILGTASITGGSASIYIDRPASGSELTLTVTAFNYLPYISSIEVINKPAIPALCTPLNHSKLQPINSSFSWECGDGGNPDYYLFYLGTDNPPANLINGQKVTGSQLKYSSNFEYDQQYYWKVVAVNSFGTSESKVMNFETVFAPDEDFEATSKRKLNWSDGGMQKWTNDASQYFDGEYSIRSGKVNDNEYSSLIYPCEVTNCDFVSFWSRTSSDAGDKLQFMIDGKIIEEWSGISEWDFHIYKVEAGSHLIEWRYAKNEGITAGEDAAWLDNIHLPLHAPVTATVIDNGSVCQGSAFETSVTAENYFSVSWTTEGDGTYDDSRTENTFYTPGMLDIQASKTILRMKLKGFDGCPVLEKAINLEINPLPEITLPSDTIISNGNTVELDVTLCGDMDYSWQPCGSKGSSVVIDSAESVNGVKTASITITDTKGCSATKSIMIRFNNSQVDDVYTVYPNPSDGHFTIEPLKGSAIIDQMMLLDMNGKTVWKNQEDCTIIGSKQVDIKGLPGGTYFLVTENSGGRSVNPLVIE